ASPSVARKKTPRSITTWDDLVSKFINEFFPPSRTTNLRNEISNFQQKFDESFHEAWERYKGLLHTCPHYGFTELHQLDNFYNAFNPGDQDSLNAAAGGNLLEKSPQDALTIIENKSKQTSAMTTTMTAMLKQLQSNPPPAQVKAVEEICVTCGGAHPYYQCLAAGGNTFPEFQDNIQGYVSVAASNYNQGHLGYRPQGVANQMRPPGFAQPNVQNNQNRFGQPQGFNRGTNFNQEQPYQATAQSNQNFHLNELEKIKRMNDVSLKAMQNQIDMVKNELRNEMKTSIQTSLSNQTNEIKNMMASLLQMNTASTSGSGSLSGNTVANPKGELKAIITCSGLATDGPTVPTPPKFVNPEEDECVEETPFLRTARALIDVHGKEITLRDGDERLTLNMKHDTTSYSNHPYQESANLINNFNISSEDCFEDLVSNKQSGNPTFSLHKEIASPEVIHEIHDSKGYIDSFNDIHPHFDDDSLSGNTTYSTNSLLEEFTDELALITYPSDYDDNRILIHEKSVKIITRVAQEKKLTISFASLVFEDFDPPFYEPCVFKDVPNSMRLLLFSSENEEKVFKPGIYTSEKVKENQEKDKIGSKPDKNEKRGEAGKSQKQLQSVEQEKLKKIQKRGPKMQSHSKFIKESFKLKD
nr:reverse transcriptase domain-containing protein [Tanacetum cinerariifolium]